ncbi:hypothetical protein EHQ53_14140 [Leptospira langatensis]|uniref:Uncharacterized protein n=1 Tax=Leptospira langatensis TaxID=2484983 RepID=A0ABY2M9P3_9LEPT|nr:hypothetical protein [Leptospira langatensis]TGL39658.1 hypothetical protein EHQ53_14140 [Leptospira langatensis]
MKFELGQKVIHAADKQASFTRVGMILSRGLLEDSQGRRDHFYCVSWSSNFAHQLSPAIERTYAIEAELQAYVENPLS